MITGDVNRLTRITGTKTNTIQWPCFAGSVSEFTNCPSAVTVVVREVFCDFRFKTELKKSSSAKPFVPKAKFLTRWIKPMNMFRLHPWLPTNLKSSVTHLPALPCRQKTSTALSTVSSAIALYVVHFPPAIVNNPLSETWII